MFRTTSRTTQKSLFSGFDQQFQGKKLKQFSDSKAWHNVFRTYITSQIDESIFAQLFNEDNGRPNASIRVLVAMNILKEGHGWSDEQLFEQARFNVLVMNALGLSNLDDEVPTESTYYLFRQKLYLHQIQTGEDLHGECFKQLTKNQAELFGVNGQKIRMDSKLSGSNIATCSRLQLVINCIQVFYKNLNEDSRVKIPECHQELLQIILQKSAGQIVFRLSLEEKSEYLEKLGVMLMDFQTLYSEKESSKYFLIQRIFEEQYSVFEEEIKLKPNSEITAKSIQSIHDLEATYRNKDKQKIQGYSINVTETCNDDGLNLITHTKVKESTTPDTEFMQEAIEASEQIVGNVEESYQDGAYHSQANDKYAEKNNKQFYFTGLQGAKGRYEFEEKDNELLVKDSKTGKVQVAKKIKENRYRIEEINEHDKKKYYYFSKEAIESFYKRQEIENYPEEIKNKRANVEATIFQLSFLMRNNKTRYRGKHKTQIWSHCRSLWINMKRIEKYLGELYLNTSETPVFIQNLIENLKIMLNFAKKFVLRKLFSRNLVFSKIFIQN